MEKIAAMPILDYLYNWIVDFYTARTHCTKSKELVFPALDINASVVQGSALGPVSFILNATDLRCSTKSNSMRKYADDCDLIVPSTYSATIPAEMDHIAKWARENYLKLNCSKSLEMIVRHLRAAAAIIPPPIPGKAE